MPRDCEVLPNYLYQVFRISQANKLQRPPILIEATGEDDAIQQAQALVVGDSIELWYRTRRIGQFGPQTGTVPVELSQDRLKADRLVEHRAPAYRRTPRMTDHVKLMALYDRLAAEQQRLIEASAKIGMLPPASTLRKISDIEHALSAVDAMIEEAAE